jgi:hypothetical protein
MGAEGHTFIRPPSADGCDGGHTRTAGSRLDVHHVENGWRSGDTNLQFDFFVCGNYVSCFLMVTCSRREERPASMKSRTTNKISNVVPAFSLFVVSFAALSLTVGCKGEHTAAPLKEFKAEIKTIESNKTVFAGDSASTQLDIKNTSTQTWPSKGAYAVHVAYHLLDSDKKVVTYEGVRTGFPEDIKPNETAKVAAAFSVPANPGNYIVHFTLVQETVSWFDTVGPSNAVDLPVKVIPKQ